MGTSIQLTAADGFVFPAYVAQPSGQYAGKPRGAIVVVQEIFGVNSHIRAVADGYAEQGYLAMAPATFERAKRGVDLGYTQEGMGEGFALKGAIEALPAPGLMQDVQATVDYAARTSGGKVGMVGYCWGGLITWRSAALVNGLAAAVPYYGGGMTLGDEPTRQPQCPVLCHFSDQDHYIPMDSVAAFQKLQPSVTVHIYNAQHGFNCDQRAAGHAPSAQLARERTLAFFAQHVG